MRVLQNVPRPQGVKKLAGDDDLYRIREGDYRIVSTLRDNELVVLVVTIGDRKEVDRESTIDSSPISTL